MSARVLLFLTKSEYLLKYGWHNHLGCSFVREVDEIFLIMTLIYLSFNAYKLNLRFNDKWTIIQKKLVQSHFGVSFGTSILNNSFNRLNCF